MRIQFSVIPVVVVFSLAGCAGMTETRRATAIGAGVGASTGALIGAVAGRGTGAAIGAAAGAGVGAIAGNVWSRRMEEQKREMEQATSGTGVGVARTADNRLKLEIPSDISFDTGRAEIKPDFRPVLDSFATSVISNPGTQVTIVGHTDSSGSDAVNNPLSFNRAASARDYLVSRGVSQNRTLSTAVAHASRLSPTTVSKIRREIAVSKSLWPSCKVHSKVNMGGPRLAME